MEGDAAVPIGEIRVFHCISAQSFHSGVKLRIYARHPEVGMAIPHRLGGLLGPSDRAARYFGDVIFLAMMDGISGFFVKFKMDTRH